MNTIPPTEPSSNDVSPAPDPQTTWWLRSRFGSWFLAAVSFAESVFAPILIDPFLIALIMVHPKRWRWYVVISVLASVLGGVVAYVLGAWFFQTVGVSVLQFYNLEDSFTNIAAQADANGFVFVLIGAFTPIPYKIVALASGVLQLNLITFLVASIVGRFLRLGLVGLAAHYAGPKMLPLVRRHLHMIAALVGLILVAYVAYQIWG